jgi:DNA repair and recombination protein RAD54B
MLQKQDITWSRLDGSTNTSKRQDLIDKFNSKSSTAQVFLLSAKAGGYGINLIGANRLVLFDPDWNPSVDLQAMSRVYREGQTKNVYIYRLVATGTIEEKIFQRQIVKTALSKTVVDEKKSKSVFTKEMLKELFLYNEDSKCQTYQEEEDDDFESKIKVDTVLFKVYQKNPQLVSFIKKIEDENTAVEVEEQEEGSEQEESSSSEDEYDFDLPPSKKKKTDDSIDTDEEE